MKLKQLFVALATFGLMSCSITSLPGDVKSSLKTTNENIESANTKIQNVSNNQNDSYIEKMKGGYFGNSTIATKDTDFLPPVFNDPIQMDRTFFSMRQVADNISKLTGIPTLVDADGIKDLSIRVTQQSGNLVDLLNSIAAQTDTAWSYKDGKLILSETETQTWFIKGIPGDIQVKNQVNSTSGIQGQSGGSAATAGQGGGGQSTSQSQSQSQQSSVQDIQYNLANSLWDNFEKSISSMLSKSGKLSIMPASSSVTVSDRPSVILKVGSFVKKQNDMLKRQVQIDVQIFAVETNKTDNYGINWNLLLKGANASFSINGAAAAGSSAAGVAGGLSPVFIPTAATQSFTIGATSGDLTGSQLIMNALSTETNSSLVTTAAVTTLNNQPAPVQVVEQQSYVASVSTTQVAQAGTQNSLTPGQITYGFVLNILPVIEDNGLVNLQISVNLSSLKALTTFGVTGATVQLPDIVQRNTMQKATLRAGDTYVLTGFDSDFNTITNTGVGGVTNWWLGGGVSAQKTRSRLVVLVTPRIVNM